MMWIVSSIVFRRAGFGFGTLAALLSNLTFTPVQAAALDHTSTPPGYLIHPADATGTRVPYVAGPKPAKGQWIDQAAFHTRYRRVSDVVADGVGNWMAAVVIAALPRPVRAGTISTGNAPAPKQGGTD